MNNYPKNWGFIIVILSIVLLNSCNEKPLEPEIDSKDTTPPTVFIGAPTSYFSFATNESEITLAGNAADDVELKEIKWSSSSGENGIGSGLENWSTGNISLVTGDNIITITATDMAGNVSEDEIIITYNEYLEFSGHPFADPAGIFVNTPTVVTINITIAQNPNLIKSSVRLLELDINNNIVQEIVQMYDDGDPNHGDETADDGIYSTKVTMTKNQSEELKLRVSAETQESSGSVKGFSAIFLYNVVEHIQAQDEEVLKNTVDSALVRLKEFYENQSNSLASSISSTIEWLKTLPAVDNAYLSGGQMLKIEYSSGLLSGIVFSEVDAQGRIVTQGNSLITELDKNKNNKKFLPRKPFNLRKPETLRYAKDDNELLNKKILIYEPFADLFYPANKGTTAKQILENSDITFEITHLKNQNATVEALYNLTDYGFIIIDTHGIEGENFFSGEYVNDATRAKYELLRSDDYSKTKIFPAIQAKIDPIFNTFRWGEASYWVISSKFIEGLNGNFTNAVIFNSSCESTLYSHTSFSLTSVFISKGAKSYLGVNDLAGSKFLGECLFDFTGKFGRDLKTTGESFTAGKTYTNSMNRIAKYEIYGSKDIYYSPSLTNLDFTKCWVVVRVGSEIYKKTNLITGNTFNSSTGGEQFGNVTFEGSFSGNIFNGNYENTIVSGSVNRTWTGTISVELNESQNMANVNFILNTTYYDSNNLQEGEGSTQFKGTTIPQDGSLGNSATYTVEGGQVCDHIVELKVYKKNVIPNDPNINYEENLKSFECDMGDEKITIYFSK